MEVESFNLIVVSGVNISDILSHMLFISILILDISTKFFLSFLDNLFTSSFKDELVLLNSSIFNINTPFETTVSPNLFLVIFKVSDKAITLLFDCFKSEHCLKFNDTDKSTIININILKNHFFSFMLKFFIFYFFFVKG
jgi:hypothetical protein